MKRKLSCILLAFVMMLAAVPLLGIPAFAEDSVNLQTKVEKNNGQVIVTVSTAGELNADGISFDLLFDDRAFELLYSEEQPCTYTCQYNFGETATSPYKCSWINLEKAKNRDGTTQMVNGFDVKKPYQGDLFKFVFAIKNVEISETYEFVFDDIECSVLDIKDDNGKTVAEEKSLTVNIKPISVVPIAYGDIDNNMVVDLADALYLKRCLAGWDGYSIIDRAAADLDGDNEITVKDVTALERHIAGWNGYESLPKSE